MVAIANACAPMKPAIIATPSSFCMGLSFYTGKQSDITHRAHRRGDTTDMCDEIMFQLRITIGQLQMLQCGTILGTIRGVSGTVRADQALADRGLAESRTRAQALILAGLVYSGDRRVEKAGQSIAADAPLTVKGRDHPWVSRGGLKLAHGLDHFGWYPAGAVAIDVGASTGGFTDVLLARGAARVHAVDVGHGQLAWRLREDPRVVVLERTNARHLTVEHVPDPIDMVVCDASFIALAKVLPAALALARPGARLVALIKPQFEAGRGEVGKGGVVRDAAVHARVCAEVRAWLEASGWAVADVATSPITGPEGNVEFLIGAQKAIA